MIRRFTIPMVFAPALVVGCAAHRDQAPAGTLADLRNVRPDVQEAKVEQGLDEAMQRYRRFLNETQETAMTPEAMRRLADLQLEKQFGIRTGDGKPREMAAPQTAQAPAGAQAAAGAQTAGAPNRAAVVAGAGLRESDEDFEKRATAQSGLPSNSNADASQTGVLPAGADPAGPLEAIAIYEKLLKEYPSYENSDKVLYQMSRAYDELGRTEEAMATMERLIGANPHSVHYDEVQFRRGEYYFTRRQYRDAENAYSAVIGMGGGSEYYELALYKLGWTFFKQDLSRRPCRGTWGCSTTRCRSAMTSIDRKSVV